MGGLLYPASIERLELPSILSVDFKPIKVYFYRCNHDDFAHSLRGGLLHPALSPLRMYQKDKKDFWATVLWAT